AIGHYNHSNFHVSGRVTGGVLGFLIGMVMVFGLAEVDLLNSASLGTKMVTMILLTLSGIFVLGPMMKKLFNSPEMHIWHHTYTLPEGYKYGINFGISLAIWDYIFGTASIPKDGKDIRLGFPEIESFPHTFREQMVYGIKK
ncbi:MAG: sterol desaturase family protein, partial [Saprospiraceae bacterium]